MISKVSPHSSLTLLIIFAGSPRAGAGGITGASVISGAVYETAAHGLPDPFRSAAADFVLCPVR